LNRRRHRTPPNFASWLPATPRPYFGQPTPNQGKLLQQGIERIVHHLRGVQIGMALGGYWYLLCKYRFRKFRPMLRKYLDNLRMEQLVIPMFTISADLVDGIPVFDISDLTRADEMAKVGERTTDDSVSQLKRMLSKLDPKLFG
jgi:hypothetical protein